MSWEERGPTIEVRKFLKTRDARDPMEATKTYSTTTSCSTVLIPDDLLGRHKMRLFSATLNFPGKRNADFYVNPTAADESAWTVDVADYADSGGKLIGYIDSEPLESLLFMEVGGEFTVAHWRPEQHFATLVRHEKDAQAWGYTHIDKDQVEYDEPVGIYDWDVTYKDTHVLEIPGGRGWMMILTRVRAAIGLDEGDTPGHCLSDLVFWWCDNPSFKGSLLVGPFQLVDSLRAWPGELPIRLWLGTASAVVTQRDGIEMLVVYTSAEANRPNVEQPPYKVDDDVSIDQYGTMLDAADFSGACVAVIALSLSTILYRIRTEVLHMRATGQTRYTDESTWTSSTAPPCTPLGRIRVFVQWSDGVFREFEDVYRSGTLDDPDATWPTFADPAAAACDGRISLYASTLVDGQLVGVSVTMAPARALSLGSGHGIWRLRDVREGDTFNAVLLSDGGTVPITAGFATCFVVARPVITEPDAGLRSPDQICESDANFVRMDPDPTRTPSGAWRVNVGTNLLVDNQFDPLTQFVGSSDDGCALAEELWTESAGSRLRLQVPVLRSPEVGRMPTTPRTTPDFLSLNSLGDGIRLIHPEGALLNLARDGWTIDWVRCQPIVEGLTP